MAIIAVLVAIAIPMFTAQLEKAREATDEANIRSAYAVVSADALTKSGEAPDPTGQISYTLDANGYVSATVTSVQTQEGWQSLGGDNKPSIGSTSNVNAQINGAKWTVAFDGDTVNITPAS